VKPAQVPRALVAALPRGGGAEWSHLSGLGAGAWLVRRPEGADVVVRQASETEERAARAAAEVAVGPIVLASAEGWLASEYLDGVRVTALELSRPVWLAELAALLRRLHSCDVALAEAPMADARRAYAANLGAGELTDPLRVAIDDADRLERELSGTAPSLVPAHLDVVANLLMTSGGLRLIDFEFAAAADPARELGQLIWEAEVDGAGARLLVDAYGSDGVGGYERAVAWSWVAGVTWTAWALSHGDSIVMRRYGLRSWERLQSHWWRPTGDPAR
jgi:thiamine kinase